MGHAGNVDYVIAVLNNFCIQNTPPALLISSKG
jgi:hypothetical protein